MPNVRSKRTSTEAVCRDAATYSVVWRHRQAAPVDKKRTKLSQNAGHSAIGRPAHQWPVFGIDAQGSFGGRASPFCSNSTD
jgi:hypothetical protein